MGKPTAGNAAVPPAEFIGGKERTEGSETSQYLEEKKANAIPEVVASERGTAQTEWTRVCSGLRGVMGMTREKRLGR